METIHPLRKWRFAQEGLTLRQAAAKFGCSSSRISQIENGGYPPGGKLIERIKAVTGLSADEILNSSPSQAPHPNGEDV